jgi:hypothetical protein
MWAPGSQPVLIRNSPTISPPTKTKCLFEQFKPARFVQGMVGCQPLVEAAMASADALECLGILDGSIHLEPVADDARICQQALPVRFVIGGHRVYIESIIGTDETLLLFQYC